jgi:hypothetical protein
MRERAIALGEEILAHLNQKLWSNSPEEDAAIKITALCMCIAAMMAHYAMSRQQLARARRDLFAVLSQEINDAWTQRQHHSIEDTQEMLRAIGIIKDQSQ